VASKTPPSRIATWIFFGALAYLLAASLLSRLVRLPTLGDIGFTLVFTAFSLSHAAATLGGRRMAVFFVVTALVSWLFEFYGVSTRAVYGAYHYGDGLGIKVGGVPALIPLAWFMMIYPSWHLGGILLGNLRGGLGVFLAARSWIAAMVMTMWDTVMDPAMASRGAWVWEQGGPYFGVPFQNYLGWLVTTFTVYLLAGMLMRAARAPAAGPVSRGFRSLPLVIYALMAATYLLPRRVVALEPLRIVAAFTMGFAAVLGLLRMAFAEGVVPAGKAD
jgi:putative membrane protein